MSNPTLEQQLSRAEWQIAQGEAHIRQQRLLLSELQENAEQLRKEREILRELEYMHSLDVADRDRLRNYCQMYSGKSRVVPLGS